MPDRLIIASLPADMPHTSKLKPWSNYEADPRPKVFRDHMSLQGPPGAAKPSDRAKNLVGEIGMEACLGGILEAVNDILEAVNDVQDGDGPEYMRELSDSLLIVLEQYVNRE